MIILFGLEGTSVSALKNSSSQDPILVKNLTSAGIDFPIVDYGYSNGSYLGPNLNPITIAQKSIKSYELLEKKTESYEGENSDLERNILVIGDWFKTHPSDNGNYSLLIYAFPFSYYNMTVPWYSGLAHGKAIQALLNAYRISGDLSYVELAEKLLNAFYIEVEDGGLTYKDSNTEWWYEEYSNPNNSIQPRVLNGMMFALLGIHDLYNTTHSTNAKFILDQGISSLKSSLPKYDVLPTSLYDLLGKEATPFYQDIHVRLLENLYSITGDQLFLDYAKSWKSRR
jgi:heparosan-N-sulfate-glucuronate 5-epimerase